jgi:hypothetical protein
MGKHGNAQGHKHTDTGRQRSGPEKGNTPGSQRGGRGGETGAQERSGADQKPFFTAGRLTTIRVSRIAYRVSRIAYRVSRVGFWHNRRSRVANP